MRHALFCPVNPQPMTGTIENNSAQVETMVQETHPMMIRKAGLMSQTTTNRSGLIIRWFFLLRFLYCDFLAFYPTRIVHVDAWLSPNPRQSPAIQCRNHAITKHVFSARHLDQEPVG